MHLVTLCLFILSSACHALLWEEPDTVQEGREEVELPGRETTQMLWLLEHEGQIEETANTP